MEPFPGLFRGTAVEKDGFRSPGRGVLSHRFTI